MDSFKGRLLLFIGLGILAVLAIYELAGGDLGAIVGGVSQTLIQEFAQAIASAEGFGVANAIPTRANNPGDLTDVGQNFTGDTGQRIGANIIVFDTVQDGWNALYSQVRLILGGSDSLWPSTLTLAQAGLQYSGCDPNWATNVANDLDIDPSITLGEIAGGQS